MRHFRAVLAALVVSGFSVAGCASGDDAEPAAGTDPRPSAPVESEQGGSTSTVAATDATTLPPTPTPPSVADEIEQGGSASIITGIDAPTLDPTTVINTWSQGSTLMNALYDVLFTVDEAGQVQGRLATDFSSDDGITWTLRLREGVQFSDGTSFDADAVLAQWNRLKENIRASSWSHLQHGVQSWAAIDPLTIQVVLNAPNQQFHQTVAWSNLEWIPSPTAMAAAGDRFGDAPVGAGPFLLTSRTPGVETVFERNPTFWEQGYPKLDSLTVQIVGDPQQARDTFDTGGADATMHYPSVQEAEDQGYGIVQIDLIGGTCWLFGTKGPPFDDIRARRAVYLAIDMDRLNQNVWEGKRIVATSLFPEGTPFHNPDIVFPERDPEEAQRLFDELAAEGKPVELTVIGTPGNQAQMVELQTQLRQFDNVDVEVSPIDGPTYGATLYSGDFQMAIYGVLGRDPEPALEGFRTAWPIPIASLDDPAIDAALDAGRQATDLGARQAAYDDLQRALNEQYRLKWMTAGSVFAATTDEVGGLELYGQGSLLVHGFGRHA